MATDTSNAAIVMRESTSNPCYTWRQYIVVTAARQVTIHMTPALFGGWRFQRVDVTDDAWPSATAMLPDAMVEYLLKWWDDGLTHRADDLDSTFRARLLKIASSGELDRPADS